MKTASKALVILMCFSLSSCSSAESTTKNIGDNLMIKLDNLQDWCTGRYTFKVPKEASPIGGMDKYNSFIIKSELDATHETLKKAYAEKLQKYSEKDMRILADEKEVKVGDKVIKVFKAKYGADNRGTNDVFAWVLDNKILFTITGTYSLQYKDQSDEALTNLLNNLSFRDNRIMPKQAGVCINNGFIKNSGQPFRNSVHSFGFEFKQYPSVRVFFETEAPNRDPGELIDRIKNNLNRTGNYAAFKAQNKTIKKGKKSQIAGDQLTGEEWIFEVPLKGQPGLVATFEYRGSVKNALDPLVNLEIDSAFNPTQIKTSSISQSDATKLYDVILNTIKKF